MKNKKRTKRIVAAAVAAALLAPQRLLERLMVREPHVQMLEVAVCAYNAARENDQ